MTTTKKALYSPSIFATEALMEDKKALKEFIQLEIRETLKEFVDIFEMESSNFDINIRTTITEKPDDGYYPVSFLIFVTEK